MCEPEKEVSGETKEGRGLGRRDTQPDRDRGREEKREGGEERGQERGVGRKRQREGVGCEEGEAGRGEGGESWREGECIAPCRQGCTDCFSLNPVFKLPFLACSHCSSPARTAFQAPLSVKATTQPLSQDVLWHKGGGLTPLATRSPVWSRS